MAHQPHARGKGSAPARAALAAAFLIAALLLGSVPAFAADLTARLDRPVVALGETFTLLLSLSGSDSAEPPNTSALAKDFNIIERRRGSRRATADGKRTTVNDWVLTLEPKRTGRLVVPPLSLAGFTTQSLKVQVTPATTPADTRSLFVSMEVAQVAPYAQSEVPATLRVYDAEGVRSGSLANPRADGATLTPKGEQVIYYKTLNGKRYRVVEQDYLLLPQKSGPVTIEPVTLDAVVPGVVPPQIPTDMSQLLGRAQMPWLQVDPGRNVTLSSRPVTVNVRPRPAEAKGWFLPARDVRLTQEWSSPPGKAKVGDTLTRTIRLEALGASPNQLPPLPVIEADGARQYEDDSQSATEPVEGGNAAVLTKTVSVVLTRPGEVTLPAMEVGWWNVAANRQEQAILPATTFTVAGGAATPQSGTAQGAASAPSPASDEPGDGQPSEARPNPVLLAGGAVVLAVAAAALVLRRRRRPEVAAPRATVARLAPLAKAKPALAGPPPPPGAGLDEWERDLLAACRRHDAEAAHRACLAWARLRHSNGPGASPDKALDEAAAEVGRHLYGGAAGAWNGTALRAAVLADRKARRHAARPAPKGKLAPLYPEVASS